MTQYARPTGTTSDGNWTNNHTAVDNTNDPTGTGADGDFVIGDGTGASEIQLDLALGDTITDPETGADHKLYFRFRVGDNSDGSGTQSSSSSTVTVKLMEGGSTRVTRTIDTGTTPALSDSFTYNSATSGATGFNLTAGEANSISSYNDVFIRILYEDSEGTEYLSISQVVLEAPDASAGTPIGPISMNTYRQLRN
jgi:hypothetical protein